MTVKWCPSLTDRSSIPSSDVSRKEDHIKVIPPHVTGLVAICKLRCNRFHIYLRSSTKPHCNSLSKLCFILLLYFIVWILIVRGHKGSKSSKNGITSNTYQVRKRAYPRSFAYAYTVINGIIVHSEYYPPETTNSFLASNPKRILNITLDEIDAEERLSKSEKFRLRSKDLLVKDDCVQQYDWQLTTFPTCNAIHEVNTEKVRSINAGYWRDVWKMRDNDYDYKTERKICLKTLRYVHDYTFRNMERHRRDALVMERLSSSSHVLDIYGYCGHSGLFEYGSGGDVKDLIWTRDGQISMTKRDALNIAIDVVTGVTQLHNFDREGRSSVAHTDVTPVQFINVDGVYKLNDFNRCRFLGWDVAKDESCGYKVGRNPHKFRSPEEYRYDNQSEKVDVYSMGNVLYVLLNHEWVFSGMEDEIAQSLVKSGGRPVIKQELKNSTDPIDITLIRAIDLCWIHNPDERARARDVLNYLLQARGDIDS